MVTFSMIVSIICVGIWCFVGWQYVTGREYWGSGPYDLRPILLFGLTIPVINLIIMALTIATYTALFIGGQMDRMRQKAIERRMKNE